MQSLPSSRKRQAVRDLLAPEVDKCIKIACIIIDWDLARAKGEPVDILRFSDKQVDRAWDLVENYGLGRPVEMHEHEHSGDVKVTVEYVRPQVTNS